LERAQRHSTLLAELNAGAAPYGLVTLHRPANVDEPGALQAIMDALIEIAAELPLYFPVHPRTRVRMGLLQRQSDRIRLLEPLGYLDFLALMSRSSIVLTDSGGIQEETTALGVPCLTVRDNTERPITITEGTNRLAGTNTASILAAWQAHKAEPKIGRIPALWDGRAAARCVQALQKFLEPGV
jgi:UDP-N-acetylglucosamine 2-epimerase (non-hydrolysing)